MEIKRGEIYYVSFGTGIGSEQSGIRPCIVVSNDLNNEHSTVVSVVPLTTATNKAQIPTHKLFTTTDVKCLKKDSIALCEQVRCVSKLRFKNRIGALNMVQMESIEHGLKIQLGL